MTITIQICSVSRDRLATSLMSAGLLTATIIILISVFILKPCFTYDSEENAKWLMNILWAMDGMDLNLNTQISKHLADLGQTLTTLTSEEGGVADQYNNYHSDASSYSLSSSDSDDADNGENVCGISDGNIN